MIYNKPVVVKRRIARWYHLVFIMTSTFLKTILGNMLETQLVRPQSGLLNYISLLIVIVFRYLSSSIAIHLN